jgi:outer membrane biosynthesis protein TonB
MPSHPARRRDAALHRLGRVNRWLIVGSVALTGVLAEVAASAFAGRTLKARAAGRTSPHAKPSAPATTATQPLSPPAAPPSSETQPSPGESGQPAPEAAQPQHPEAPQAQAQPEAPRPQPAPEAPRESAPQGEPSAPATSGGS